MQEKVRCSWANPKNSLYVRYHDEEWGVPVHDDHKLFEMLILEGFQAGSPGNVSLTNGRRSAGLLWF